MNFNTGNTLDTFLNILFERYCKNVPAVEKITDTLIKRGVINSQEEIVNDHIAFRTLAVPHLGINHLRKFSCITDTKKGTIIILNPKS